MTLAEALKNPTNRQWHVKYVIHSNVDAYKALGWHATRVLEDSHHGHYAVLMEWMGEGEPREPSRDQ
jgi:hypothetical protein